MPEEPRPAQSGPRSPAAADAGAAPPAVRDDLLERLRNGTLGEYEIYGELGRGGMATVYVAHDIALDRKVAIKVISPVLLHGEGMVERFKREARTAASLSHPNIIPVYAVREAEGLCFFVMKLVQGTTLEGILRQMGTLPIPMAEAILTQVGGALGYAHRHGVIHRDIKPGNILIDDEGWVVVTDFGIAKVADAEGLTLTGMAVGTPAYMSPEQCTGGPITSAADQYSLGVVAYEMLTGRPPFSGTTSLALMYNQANIAPSPLENLRPDCPEGLTLAVTRMLEKDPGQRWRSMEEALAAIGTRTLAHDDPTRGKLVELARTGMTNAIIARVQTPRSPVPLTASGWRSQKSQPGGAAPPPERRSKLPVAAAGLLLGMALTAVAAYVWSHRSGGRPAPVPAPVPPSAAPAAASEAPRPAASSLTVAQRPQVPQPSRVSPPPAAPMLSRPSPPPPAAPARSPDSARVAPPPAAESLPPARVTTPAPAPVPLAPPPPPPPPPVPVTPVPVLDARSEIEATITAYGRALESGDLSQVRRAYPGMTAAQQEGLTAFYRSGGTLRTRWAIQNVVIQGDTATARILGNNLVSTPRGRPGPEQVRLRVRLERQDGGWRLVAVSN